MTNDEPMNLAGFDNTYLFLSNDMSPSSSHTEIIRSKFTRGEKCIFSHLIVTFSLIILLVIIYFIHLLMVKHTRNDVLKIYRRTEVHTRAGAAGSNYQYVGMLYLEGIQQVICNTLLLHKHWSLAPAQCTSMRTDPSMAEHLALWKIKYKINSEYIQSDIKGTLTHTHFNRGDFGNNIGLLQHMEPIIGTFYVAPSSIVLDDDFLKNNAKDMFLLDWQVDLTIEGNKPDAFINYVAPLNFSMCSKYTAPIVETLRSYEFCVTFGGGQVRTALDHGAILVMNSNAIGFFSWGDLRGKDVPFVILNILHFRHWFENIIL